MRDGAQVEYEAFPVDLDALLRTMERLELWRTISDEMLAEFPHHTVVYEDDLLPADAHQRTADAAYEFLGFGSAPATSTLLRIAPLDVRARVTNYDELAERLSTTRFVAYLDPQAGQPE